MSRIWYSVVRAEFDCMWLKNQTVQILLPHLFCLYFGTLWLIFTYACAIMEILAMRTCFKWIIKIKIYKINEIYFKSLANSGFLFHYQKRVERSLSSEMMRSYGKNSFVFRIWFVWNLTKSDEISHQFIAK